MADNVPGNEQYNCVLLTYIMYIYFVFFLVFTKIMSDNLLSFCFKTSIRYLLLTYAFVFVLSFDETFFTSAFKTSGEIDTQLSTSTIIDGALISIYCTKAYERKTSKTNINITNTNQTEISLSKYNQKQNESMQILW